MISALNNPVWEALSTEQASFNIGNGIVKYFPQDIAPFIGMQNWDEIDKKILLEQIPSNRSFSVMIANEITLPSSVQIIFTTPLYQMYCPVLQPFILPVVKVRNLQDTDIPEMLTLTALTKPGPFYENTIRLGHYYGIFHEDKLVAMTGERLKLTGYTETSAVCTHPDYLGKGYASHLLSHASEKVLQNGQIPFLHVRKDNLRAIQVYEKLGFQKRASVYFAIFKTL